jgi:hypothetical protein
MTAAMTMKSPTTCMVALRYLSTDATLELYKRLETAERTIKHYLEQAGNADERRSMLLALNNEITTVAEADEFWSRVRDMIAQLLNQLPPKD